MTGRGLTLVEKILSAHHGGSPVRPDQEIEVEPEVLFFYGSNLFDVLGRADELACSDPGRVVLAMDQNAGDLLQQGGPAGRRKLRDLVHSCGITHFYDLGRGGVPSVLFTDLGFVRPGSLVAGIDQHLAALGALGAFPLALDSAELLRAFQGEPVTMRVPETVRIVLSGEVQRWVRGEDIGLHLLDHLDRDKVIDRVVELTGEGLEQVELSDRLALAATLQDLGAVGVLIEPDERTRLYVRARSARGFPLERSDENALFADRIELDLRSVKTRVLFSEPGGTKNVPLQKVKETPVQQVVIGACCGGRIEDLRASAGFLREYMINPDVRFIVVPGSQQVLLHAMEEGLIQIIMRAGGHVGLPSCSYGKNSREASIAAGELCLTSGLCPGEFAEVADRGGKIAFCNPVIATVSAVMGEIVAPLDLVRRLRRMSTGIPR